MPSICLLRLGKAGIRHVNSQLVLGTTYGIHGDMTVLRCKVSGFWVAMLESNESELLTNDNFGSDEGHIRYILQS